MLKSLSHLTRGAWIEIKELMEKDAENKSHLTRGAWIEIMVDITSLNFDTSHLTRGAWIEIMPQEHQQSHLWVAPHTRCVD